MHAEGNVLMLYFIIIITRTASHTTKYIRQRDSPLVRLLGGEGTIPKSTQYVTARVNNGRESIQLPYTASKMSTSSREAIS